MKYLAIVLGLLLAGVAGCDDSPSATVQTTDDVFPNVVGTQWTFLWVDSLTDTSDTVVVRVETTERYQGRAAKLWRARFRSTLDTLGAPRVDTFHVIEAGDTVLAYRNFPPHLLSVAYPLGVGKTWTSADGLADTTTVAESLGIYGLPVGILHNVSRVRRQYTLSDSLSEVSDLFLASGWGLVEMKFFVVDLRSGADTLAHEHWVLLDFDDAE